MALPPKPNNCRLAWRKPGHHTCSTDSEKNLSVPEHVMEGDITTIMEPLHFVAHVLEQQLVLVEIHLQPAPQKPQQKFHSEGRDYSLGKIA